MQSIYMTLAAYLGDEQSRKGMANARITSSHDSGRHGTEIWKMCVCKAARFEQSKAARFEQSKAE